VLAALMTAVLLETAFVPPAPPDAETVSDAEPAGPSSPGTIGGSLQVPPPAPVSGSSPIEMLSPEDVPASRRPEMKSWVEGDASSVKLGQTVKYVVEVRRREGDKVHLPADTSFGDLELLDKTLVTGEPDDGWVTERYELELIALTLGRTTIPPLAFRAILEDGDIVLLETGARGIDVLDPTVDAEDEDPRDTAEVVDVYQEDYTLLWILIGIVVAVVAVLLVRWLVLNWSRWRPPAEVLGPPPRPPEIVARQKLEALRAGGYPAPDEKKGWYIELSEILREYIGARYGFDGLESTTEEIIVTMRGVKTAGLTQAELFSFLNGCDLVKFAKYAPDTDEDAEAIDEAFRIVDVTTPTESAVDAERKSGGEEEAP